MNPLDIWRREINALIPAGFLRRSRAEDSLLVSDYPARLPDPERITESLKSAGYTVRIAGGLAHLDGSPEKYRALIAALPDPPPPALTEENAPLALLAGRMERTGGKEIDVPLLRFLLKALDAGDEGALAGGLPPMIAKLQRQKKKPPQCAARIIFCYLERSVPRC